MTSTTRLTHFRAPGSGKSQRPANWNPRTEAPSDWQYVAEICAERGEFAFSDIHAEYKRLQAVRNAA
jgi:hypothetical protein